VSIHSLNENMVSYRCKWGLGWRSG